MHTIVKMYDPIHQYLTYYTTLHCTKNNTNTDPYHNDNNNNAVITP